MLLALLAVQGIGTEVTIRIAPWVERPSDRLFSSTPPPSPIRRAIARLLLKAHAANTKLNNSSSNAR